MPATWLRRSEARPIDLSLENVYLMAKSEDLGVTLFSRRQQQPETTDQEPEQVRDEQCQGRSWYRSSTL